LWHGTDTVTDLHPSFNFAYSYAEALSETKQYGYGAIRGSSMHALLWRGSAESYSDLNPAGFAASKIVAGTETTQVGTAYLDADLNFPHAFLWHDTASSAIDLNPIGFLASSGEGAFGDNQIGWGAAKFGGGSARHALLWHGSANDFVDLHQYLANLPVTFTDSYAYGIDANRNIVGFAYDSNNRPHAVMWTVTVAEPQSGLALFLGMIALQLGAHRKRA
jgi:hypothetical protein